MNSSIAATWAIAGIATAGVITRPMRWPEWTWAVSGALLLLSLGLIPAGAALAAVGKGLDVYWFLIGMMLLSETARVEGLFDWVAASAVNFSRGSRLRLFTLVYAPGTIVTTFLSNDATAVVLTPAVFAAAKKAKAEPLPLLFTCALIANAASFVLPISNPANLVLYGGHMPPLAQWSRSFALPSAAAVVVTFALLWFLERRLLTGSCATTVERGKLSSGGYAAFFAILATAIVLVTMSSLDQPLGYPTAIAGVAAVLGVSAIARRSPLTPAKNVSWGVLLLVAGLFVLVEAINTTGIIGEIALWLHKGAEDQPQIIATQSGAILALGSNLINNLPAGLIASTAVAQAHSPRLIVDSLLIGVDLGPNLSVTGSLATILWLQVIRREGEDVGFWRFLKLGCVAMPVALVAALGARLALG